MGILGGVLHNNTTPEAREYFKRMIEQGPRAAYDFVNAPFAWFDEEWKKARAKPIDTKQQKNKRK